MKFIVTYDLNKVGQDYDKLITAIKKLPNYRFLKSAWFIKSTSSAEEISTYLRQYIDDNDRLLVAELNQNRRGWLDQAAWDFINS